MKINANNNKKASISTNHGFPPHAELSANHGFPFPAEISANHGFPLHVEISINYRFPLYVEISTISHNSALHRNFSLTFKVPSHSIFR